MPASKLSYIARRALIKNISNGWELTDIGDMPYDIIRPVLLKTANPTQLKLLEEASPQICGADAEIWISLIKRDVPKAEEKMMHPRNPRSWWKVYNKMLKEHQKEAEEDAMKLKNAYKGIKEAKKPPPAIMPGVPHLPKTGGMERAHLLAHNQAYAKKRKVQPLLSVQRFGTMSKKEPTGTAVLAKVRREAAADRQRMNSFTSPEDRLNRAKGQILVPPREFLEKHQKSQAPKPLNPNIPKQAALEPSQSKDSDDSRPKMSGAQLLDERNRQYVLQQNLAKYGTSAPPPKLEKRPRTTTQELRPGSFYNPMTNTYIDQTTGAHKKRRLA